MSRRILFNLVRPVITRNVIFQRTARHYASKRKLETSMGGIFEPFLDNKM